MRRRGEGTSGRRDAGKGAPEWTEAGIMGQRRRQSNEDWSSKKGMLEKELNNLMIGSLKVWGDVELRYLWGMKVMITFGSSVGARKFLHANKDVHERLFKNLQLWDGQLIPFDRIAWVRIHGVPVQLWEGKTFDRIGKMFGKVVESSEVSFETGNLSFDEIGILVASPHRISQEMNIEWNGNSFLVRIQESSRCWVPGFINNPVRSSTPVVSGGDGDG
ncbi:hypothetical protein L1987_71544 [Smallanthus sonchifolius]|uniref:Uncharacterized protein n=1 Tax=Smallanthus sonchifolius TaxID=185202 RepID=A0ACB9ATJ9_9ASTR|nr:hypothetical protein L1987_71544 [Smallanthus sonchifolius]